MNKWIDFKDWLAEKSWRETLEPLAMRKTYNLTLEELEEFREEVDRLMLKWKEENEKKRTR